MRYLLSLAATATLGFIATVATAAAADDSALTNPLWTHRIEFDRGPDAQGKPRLPTIAHLWIPPECRELRGLVLLQMTLLEKRLVADEFIRRACAADSLGIVFFDPGFDALFNHAEHGAGEKLLKILSSLAAESKHPELERVPWITAGHSTAGIFARNIAYWQPQRVASVLHIKSGNLHQHIVGENKSLAGVPWVSISGEFEEHGPEGGIRPEHGRESQWIMHRQALVDRRAADEQNLMSLVVHPGGDHTNWDDNLSRYCGLFIRKAVQYRLQKVGEGNVVGEAKSVVKCLPLKAEDGWLTDSHIKKPEHVAAAYADYAGPKAEAFWHFDKEMADATVRLHRDKFAALPAGVKALRDLSYVNGGHERHKLDLYLPENSAGKPLPVIVWIHGGAWSHGDKAGGPAIPFSGKGYAVACINYRFSQTSLFPDQLEDCQTAIVWLRANAETYNLDGRRIGVWGASAGGHLAAMVGTADDLAPSRPNTFGPISTRVQCVVDWFGPTDFTRMGAKSADPKSPEALLLGGTPNENPKKVAAANPITYVTKDDPPFLIMHGEQDLGVPIILSELLAEALTNAGVDNKLVRIPQAGHGGELFRTPERMKEIEEFLEKYLK